MSSSFGRNALLPRPSRPIPDGTMSAPRYAFLTLVAPGTQVLTGNEWMTVDGIYPCAAPAHSEMCVAFALKVTGSELRMIAHSPVDVEGWMRHPVDLTARGHTYRAAARRWRA